MQPCCLGDCQHEDGPLVFALPRAVHPPIPGHAQRSRAKPRPATAQTQKGKHSGIYKQAHKAKPTSPYSCEIAAIARRGALGEAPMSSGVSSLPDKKAPPRPLFPNLCASSALSHVHLRRGHRRPALLREWMVYRYSNRSRICDVGT